MVYTIKEFINNLLDACFCVYSCISRMIEIKTNRQGCIPFQMYREIDYLLDNLIEYCEKLNYPTTDKVIELLVDLGEYLAQMNNYVGQIQRVYQKFYSYKKLFREIDAESEYLNIPIDSSFKKIIQFVDKSKRLSKKIDRLSGE